MNRPGNIAAKRFFRHCRTCTTGHFSPASPVVLSVLFLSAALLAGCDLMRADSGDREQPGRTLDEAAGIIWTLERWDTGETDLRRDDLPDFNLVFNDSTHFQGDDGCNKYYGEFTVENDSVNPSAVYSTQIACDFATFPYDHLTQPFLPEFGHDELTIKSGDGIYHYRSSHPEEVAGTPMVATRWRLSGSTDREIDNFEGNMIPELSLNADRTFAINWYWDADDSVFDSYRIKGYWGIAEDGEFRFYETGSRGGSAGQSQVMSRLTNVTYYRVVDRQLVLFDEESGDEHRFRPDQKD